MTSSELRCPRCAAHAPASAQWCSLCYADLRAPAPEAPADEQPVSDPATEPAARPGGKHARRADPADQPSAVPADVEETAAALLAQLAASESGNPFGRYSSLVDTPAKKVGLMVGGAVVAMLALFLLMAVAGSIL